jgi:anti-sigma factor RsiW
MASPPPPPPPIDAALKAQLIAYLDGELNEDEESAVEVRLNTDPAARREATALKQTWDLLDYLPKHEPSPTFTSKTLSRLDKVPVPPPSVPLTPPPASAVPTAPVPTARVPTAPVPTAPVPTAPVPTAPVPTAPVPTAPVRRWRWLAPLAASLAALGLGYGLARWFPPLPMVTPTRDPDAELVNDLRVLEQLRQYRYADDIDLVQTLAKPELFGSE